MPTVFVLGAGASEPYGLPLGGELKENILDRYSTTDPRVAHFLNTTQFAHHYLHKFVTALRYSGLSSVDAFLERRPEFIMIGKAIMGTELLHGEVDGRLWQRANNWLTYLYGQMVGNSLEEFSKNKVAFITFNYDRCVEHFLFISLKNTFGKSDEETAEVARKINVVHLHGRLGHLPWQGGKRVIAFGDKLLDRPKMTIVTDEIKVVHEDHLLDGRDADFRIAEVMLSAAHRVYLMGFGFGARNVQRLKLDLLQPHVFEGTAYGLTDRELGACRALCGGGVFLRPYQCLDFLRQYVDLS